MALVLEIIFIILQLVLIAISVRALRHISKQTMYSYKIISLIGGIIFFAICFLSHLLDLLTWSSDFPFEIYHFVNYLITSFTGFANVVTIFILPFFCLFLIISNVVLLKKEGKSLPNLLGILLCFALIIGAASVLFSYDVLDQFFNVHSYAGYCASLLLECLFAVTMSYFECLLFATIFVTFKARRHVPSFDKDYIIILGCRMRDDGKPARLLRARIDRAVEFTKLQTKGTKQDLAFVPSGGHGADEPLAEATSMQNYLLEKRIPKSQILAEDQSKTTLENFRFSKQKIGTAEHVAFSTSSYHVFRAGVIATNAGFKNIEGIGAKSPWYYHTSALIREFVANLNSEKRLHARNLLVLFLAITATITVAYFTNLL
ncbi:YdcF family protein [Candidatus Saccharibacteria bacterium]|nr:YdcF family protein [Candidatus Saccharibacteria bacterium]